MNFTDIVRSLPVSRDLVQSAVLALRPAPRRSLTAHVGTLGLGLAVGAGVALLCAPKSGRDLRRQLSERFEGAADDLEETAERMLANSPQ
jgi:hypothetical protein